jgi:Fe2+ or Zn2+ uptake regulation protein/O6-methylguanine-DNA--protein-cysteine methyltransferase
MMPSGQPPPSERDPGALLRARGLRVTPQRRAILGAFADTATEHLSADEVHARAASTVPEISRGTVYAALAELTELGLLAAVGSPEPVRYEANAAEHQHFRCRVCLRLFDIELPAVRTDRVKAAGFQVERSVTTVEGVCADCTDYGAGLDAGAARSVTDGGTASVDLPANLAAGAVDSPVGTVLLAATAAGLVRAVYEDHVDAPALRALAGGRKGGQAARGHLADATAYVDAYFAGRPPPPTSCVVDWDALDTVSVPTLQATQAIRPGADRSYDALGGDATAHDRGLALGTNPLAIVVPCHRVTRGREVPATYVGGAERKRWLRAHEQG